MESGAVARRGLRACRQRAGWLILALLGAGPVAAQDPSPASPGPEGGIRGHVSVPDIGSPFDSVEAVLLPPEWSLLWRGDVQRRLDSYSQAYRGVIASDPDLFEELSRAARRDATVYILMRMESALGSGFPTWVRDVSAEGNFEYSRLGEGDYTLVVVARQDGRGMIWVEGLSVGGSSPEFLEVENRIQ
jgi:hypothetical protein